MAAMAARARILRHRLLSLHLPRISLPSTPSSSHSILKSPPPFSFFSDSGTPAWPLRQYSWSASSGNPTGDKDGVLLDGDEFVTKQGAGLGAEETVAAVAGEQVTEAVVGADSLWDAPLRAVISMLDGFHDVSGLPWWMVITTSTLALRLSLFPVLILQFKKVGKISQLFPKLPPPFPPPLSGISFRDQFLFHRKKRQELGCPSYLWSFAFVSVQFPCFLLWMASIRRMSLDGHPGFDTGGTLWFQNLSDFPSGTYAPVFPLLVACLHFVNVQISFWNFKPADLPSLLGLLAKYYKMYLNILSLPLLAVGFHIPQGSLVFWVTNSSLTLAQQLFLRNANIRKKMGLPDLNIQKKPKIRRKITSANYMHKSDMPMDDYVLDEKKISMEEKSSEEIEKLSPENLLQLGLQNMQLGNQDKALCLLRLATEKNPDLVRALICMGQILFSRKSMVEAAEYFERAISKIREDEEPGLLILALFSAGVSHIQQGSKCKGIENLKRLSELKEPEAPIDKACYYQGLVFLGSTLFNEGQRTEAAQYLRRAAAYDPQFEAYVKQCEDWVEENKHVGD